MLAMKRRGLRPRSPRSARGTWYLTKLILRRFMLRKKSGRIVNISSVVGHTGNPGQIPYTMVKAGLDAFTKSLGQELAGRDILVNSVAPGFIDTEMTVGAARRDQGRDPRAHPAAAHGQRRKRSPTWSPSSPRAAAT